MKRIIRPMIFSVVLLGLDIKKMVNAILNDYPGTIALICWHHGRIPKSSGSFEAAEVGRQSLRPRLAITFSERKSVARGSAAAIAVW
jgi:hypothetical protein